MKKADKLATARGIVDALEEKKAIDITLIDIHEVASFTDFFILSSGSSDRMLNSLIETVTDTANNLLGKKGRVMGEPVNGWIAIDLGDIVVHLFSPEKRAYYDLESLWSDGKVLLKIS